MIERPLNGVYKVADRVGGGGFADVYLGRDLRTNTVVAIKVLHAHYARDPQIIQRFLQEARTAQALVEPHIVRVLDAGQDSGTYYIAMEYVQGHTLAHLLQTRGSLPIQEAVEYTRQILQALEAAHRAGIVHRDIKPQNVMVTPDGTVKVMDFGIAKHAAAGKMTQTGMYLGTPQYMSPEQAKGERVDARSDLYSVAIVLFEMLGGRPPFDAESPWQVLRMQTDAEAPPLSELRPDVPLSLVQVTGQGLQKAPERRHQSAGQMLGALSGPGHEALSAGAERGPTPPRLGPAQPAGKGREDGQPPPAGLRRGPLIAALPAGLAGVALIVIWLLLKPTTPAPPITTAIAEAPSTLTSTDTASGMALPAAHQADVTAPASAPTHTATPAATPISSATPTSTPPPSRTSTPMPVLGAPARPTISTAEMSSRANNQRAWGPDGQRAAFIKQVSTGWYLFLLDRFGAEMPLTTECQASWPSWMPSGKAIVFGGGSPCGGVFLLDLGTGKSTKVASDPISIYYRGRMYLAEDAAHTVMITDCYYPTTRVAPGERCGPASFLVDIRSGQAVRLDTSLRVFDQSVFPWRILPISP